MTGPGPGYGDLARTVRDVAHRLGLRHGYLEDGEPILPGRRGFLARDGDGWTWVLIHEAPYDGFSGAQIKNKAKRDPRLELLVEGDEEAIFAIRDEADLRDVAIRWAQCRRRRVLSEEQRAVASARGRENLRRWREAKAQGHETAPESPIDPRAGADVVRAAPGGSGARNVPPSPEGEAA